ncbi:MAG: M24 family metallopeptidase [Candidatus Methanofastidiosia archaeon]
MNLSREVIERIDAFQVKLQERGIDLALILQKTDEYYLSSSLQPELLAISQDESFAISRKNLSRLKSETPIGILKIDSLKELPDILKEEGFSFKRVGFELDVLPFSLLEFLRKLISPKEIFDVSEIILELRERKSSYELEMIKRASEIVDLGLGYLCKILREGMREIDLALKIEARMREEGHQGIVRMRRFNQEVFYGHVLSGESGGLRSYMNSPTGGIGVSRAISQGAGYKKIRRGEPIFVDMVGAYQGYLSDETRIFVLGNLSPDLEELYLSTLNTLNSVISLCKVGKRTSEIYEEVFSNLENPILQSSIKKTGFLGHGVGLELDERPLFSKGSGEVLRENMTFALEPKAITKKGAIGIENTYLLEKRGIKVFNRLEEEVIRL